MNCPYCLHELKSLPTLNPYYYCFYCTMVFGVTTVLCYSEYHQEFSSIHLGWSNNLKLYRYTMCPIANNCHLASTPIYKSYPDGITPSYSVKADHMLCWKDDQYDYTHSIISPHAHVPDIAMLCIPELKRLAPFNVKEKTKTLLIFS